MALEIKQSLKLSQQLVMTPQLQQAIKLLQLNRMELQEVVTAEMMENPMLEELAETPEGENATPADSPGDVLDPESAQTRDEQAVLQPQAQEEQLVAGKDDFNWE